MKMKYKKYPRVYEKVFTSEECLGAFSFDGLEPDYPGSKNDYVDKINSYFNDFDRYFFAEVIKYYWLQRRFIYKGIRKETHLRTFIRTDSAYSTFIKHHVGFNYQLITSTFIFGKIISYLGDLFEDFDTENPFENSEAYAFPFKNIGLSHMALVYQMDERLDLLKEAEEQKMSYYEFLDFVINYINCVNDEMGKQVFTLYRPTNGFSFYIQYHFRKGTGTGLGCYKKSATSKQIRRKPYQYKKYEIKTGDIHEHEVREA